MYGYGQAEALSALAQTACTTAGGTWNPQTNQCDMLGAPAVQQTPASYCVPQTDVCYERSDVVAENTKKAQMTGYAIGGGLGLLVGAVVAMALKGRR